MCYKETCDGLLQWFDGTPFIYDPDFMGVVQYRNRMKDGATMDDSGMIVTIKRSKERPAICQCTNGDETPSEAPGMFYLE